MLTVVFLCYIIYCSYNYKQTEYIGVFMEKQYFLAIDIGASSGRHILGFIENGKLNYSVAKKDILDVLRSLKGHGFKNGVEQFFISGYEFLDIFFYGNFFPKIVKKYGLDLKERK